jgi:hypothetical protein
MSTRPEMPPNIFLNQQSSYQSALMCRFPAKDVRWDSQLKNQQPVLQTLRRYRKSFWPSLSELGRVLRSLPSRIVWLYSTLSWFPYPDCWHCRGLAASRQFRLSGSGHLGCNEDIKRLTTLHSWVTHGEDHLMARAWYLGAEWMQDNYDSERSKTDSYRVG